nr:hypothetical protein MACL_00003134 [Theileria orientalis]
MKKKLYNDHFSLLGNKIKFEMPLTILEYKVTNLMNKLVWDAQIKDYTNAVQKDHVEALKIQAMFDEKQEAYEPIILDISEQVAPELFGIDKVTGFLGNGEYILYQMKKEYADHYRIKTVVDTGCDYKELFEMDETFIFSSVEVFTNKYRKIVVINSMVKDGESLVRRQDMLKKIEEEQVYYRRVVGMARSVVYSGLEKNFPIKINLFLHEKENSVYESTETMRENEKYVKFQIRESDGRGMKYVFKYIFGDILERRRYKIGNVPEEPCIKDYNVLKKNVHQTQVIVARSGSGVNMEMTEYRVYNIL